MASFEATPTEYLGVRYRSKSEAMFARFLHLEGKSTGFSNCVGSGFEYEPEGFSVGRWSLDFLAWRVFSAPNIATEIRIPTIIYLWIEYKPSRPSGAYIEKLRKNFERLQDSLSFYDGLVVRSGFYLYYGSVYTESRGIFDFCGGVVQESKENWLGRFELDVSNYRYDLEEVR